MCAFIDCLLIRNLFETRERNYIKVAAEELRRGLIQLVPDDEEPEISL